MDTERAKFLLTVYRPDGGDAADPIFEEALEATRTDEALGRWFAEEQERSKLLSERLCEVEPPGDLRAKILAGASVSATRPWYRRSSRWMAIAAAFLLFAGGAAWWVNRPFVSGGENYAAYRTDMGTYLSRLFLLDFKSEKLEDLRSWLGREHGILDIAIPEALAAHPSVGCEVIRWHEKTAYLVCFDVGGELVHLFLLPGGRAIDGVPTEEGMQFATVDDKWSTASWSEGEDLYLVATLGDNHLLRGALGR